MLEQDETLRLIDEAQNLDSEQAKSTLISENMPLIMSIVKRYKNRGVEYDDLIQLGSIGLLKAILNFDVTFEVKFSTYAVPMIIGEIKRFLRDDGMVKVSRALKSTAAKIARFSEEFKQLNKREPTTAELSAGLEISAEDIVFALDSSKYPVSLFDKSGDPDGLALIDKLRNDNSDELIDKLMLGAIIEKLPEREKKIIILRYFRDKTQSEIAEELGVSQVQVSRLENKIIEKLKQETTEN